MAKKWAIIVDSGSDLSEELVLEKGIIKLPLRIMMNGETYSSTDLGLNEVFKAMETGPVTTSLPSGQDIIETLERLEKTGISQILMITISSGLSGTYNVMNALKHDFKNLDVRVIDSKSISMGSGLLALHAHDLLSKGLPFSEVVSKTEAKLKASKFYFTCADLEYLRRGGRLGLVAGSLANMLNLKPIISCNEEGVYYTAAKVRGYKKSIHKMIEMAVEEASHYQHVILSFINCQSEEDIEAISTELQVRIPQCIAFFKAQVSTALAIHVGPEAMGVAVLGID